MGQGEIGWTDGKAFVERASVTGSLTAAKSTGNRLFVLHPCLRTGLIVRAAGSYGSAGQGATVTHSALRAPVAFQPLELAWAGRAVLTLMKASGRGIPLHGAKRSSVYYLNELLMHASAAGDAHERHRPRYQDISAIWLWWQSEETDLRAFERPG